MTRPSQQGFTARRAGAKVHRGLPAAAPARPARASAGRRPTVSVILPTFNRAGYLAASIESVLNQRSPPSEVVVVDDGSNDGTREVVASFGDRADYVYQRNQGKLAALASGLDRVSGDLVWVMDDDDLVPETALEALRRPFEADGDLAMSYGRMLKFSERNGRLELDGPPPYPIDDPRPFFVKLLEDCFITGHPCVLVRRDALEAMRPFDRSLLASIDYYLHLGVARFGKARFVEHVVLWQRQHPGKRGPRFERWRVDERVQRWVEFDARLVEPLLEEMSPAEFLGRRRESDDLSVEELRRALIQKAVIAARKKLWHTALDAFERAFGLAPDIPFDERELSVLCNCLGCRYGLDELQEDPRILEELRRQCRRRRERDRNRALAALSRPMLHQIKTALRTGDRTLLLRTLAHWRRLMDMRTSGVALAASLSRNTKRLARRHRPRKNRASRGSREPGHGPPKAATPPRPRPRQPSRNA